MKEGKIIRNGPPTVHVGAKETDPADVAAPVD
jgi:hypothetical protein